MDGSYIHGPSSKAGSTNVPLNSDDIVGYFILTNATSPNGYLTAYYDIQNGTVAVSPLTTTLTVSCPTTTVTMASNGTTTVGLGLEIMLTLNTTQLVSGHRINATAEVFNELRTVNNVTLASIWPLPALEHPSRSGGCPSYVTVEFFQGYYTRLNLSSSAQAQVNFWTGPPPGCVEYDQTFLPFQPQSDKFAIYGASPPTFEPLFYPVWVTGYYASTNSTSTTPFPLGVYTVVAADEWGQVAIQYFTVTQ